MSTKDFAETLVEAYAVALVAFAHNGAAEGRREKLNQAYADLLQALRVPPPHTEDFLTPRDEFAMAAMTGLIVDPARADQSREECARLSYLMADAMMKAREVKHD